MSAELLVSRLDGVKRTRPGRYIARCPAHDDHKASLAICEKDDGRVLVHCFAGCDVASVLSAVDMTFSDLYPETAQGHHKPERQPFPAADILRAISGELEIVMVVASDVVKRKIVSDEDYSRLLVAYRRFQVAVEYANGLR